MKKICLINLMQDGFPYFRISQLMILIYCIRLPIPNELIFIIEVRYTNTPMSCFLPYKLLSCCHAILCILLTFKPLGKPKENV